MAHNHDTCPRPGCNTGVLWDYCDYEDCNDPTCTEVGHCDCLCHSGKTCPCGRHSWQRMQPAAAT